MNVISIDRPRQLSIEGLYLDRFPDVRRNLGELRSGADRAVARGVDVLLNELFWTLRDDPQTLQECAVAYIHFALWLYHVQLAGGRR